jgi:hypothetical protein
VWASAGDDAGSYTHTPVVLTSQVVSRLSFGLSPQRLGFLVVQIVGAGPDRRVQRHQRNHRQQVVLHYVAMAEALSVAERGHFYDRGALRDPSTSLAVWHTPECRGDTGHI